MRDAQRNGPTRAASSRVITPLAIAFLVLNLLAITGFVLRDRNVVLAFLLYLPLLPIGLAAVALDLVRRGLALSWARCSLATVGLAAIACSCLTMIGHGPQNPPNGAGDGAEVRLLHWNVLWGGLPRNATSWKRIEDDIVTRQPDIVVLSESPFGHPLESLRKRLGNEWSFAAMGHDETSQEWFRLVVLSRWPVQKGGTLPFRNGRAMEATVDRPGRPVRLLVVDGQSKVTQLRTPFLADVAESCKHADDSGRPYDVVLGDFNAVRRSVGFDALREAAGGYELASWSSSGWRGSWPTPLPLFDIDHVWVGAGCRVLACPLFANRASDHRGQLVRFDLSRSAPRGVAGRTL